MPYFTKKGIGKDKGKTCVYKKSSKEKVGCTAGPVKKYLAALYANESLKESEFSWIDDIEPEFNATMLRYGQKFKNKWGEYIRTIMFIGQDDEIVSYEKPMTGLSFKIIDDPSGYIPYPKKPKDHPLNSELFLNPLEFDKGIKSGQYTPMFDDKSFRLKESEEDEFDWIRDVEIDLVPGQIYDIKTGNGYYWVPEKYIGRKWDDEHDVEMYKFKDLDGGGSGGRSVPYVKDLMKKGHIRLYDPNWSIKDELTFSDNIEDALKGNFVIYFKDGVYLDETLSIQDKLFEMGFSFYTKGPNEYITNKDSSKKIQFFECFNWDTSNPRYKNMPSDQWDIKKILLSAVKDDQFRWKPKPNPRLDDQELFSTIKDHDATVINGDNLLNGNLTESKYSLKWIKDVKPPLKYGLADISVGDKFDAFDDFITIIDLEKRQKLVVDNDKKTLLPYFKITFKYRNGEIDATNSDIFLKLWNEGDIIKLINESDDWDWVREIPGTKEYGQTYRYFETHVCYDSFYDEDTGEDECLDGGSYFFKIPKTIVPEIWDYEAEDEYFAGPGDEGEAVIEWAIDNNIIDPNDVDMFDFVTEHDKKTWCVAWGNYHDKEECSDFLKESEENYFDWIQKQEPEKELKKSKKYVVDVSHLRPAPMKHSHDPSLTKQDILDKLKEFGYDVNHIDVDAAKYFYIEPTEGGPSWQYNEYGVPIEFDYWADYNVDLMDDPSYGGKYQTIDVDEFMFLIDNNLISESRKPINEVAGISFEARKWAEIIYNEIISNPEEKSRLIIDGYDYPETFDGFPIDYVVIDYYDRLTGYGQEHSGYDKDGNYVVLLYIQPSLVRGQGGYSLQSALNHEMKHAWEDYNRLSKGLPSVEQTKESQEMYNRDYILMLSDQNVRGPIKEILKYYYYLSNLEKSAYLENVYDQNPAYERVVREIAGMNFEPFKERFDLDVNWHLMNTAYDIPFLKKFKSPIDFIDYSAKELRSKALKMIKKINKMKYIHQK